MQIALPSGWNEDWAPAGLTSFRVRTTAFMRKRTAVPFGFAQGRLFDRALRASLRMTWFEMGAFGEMWVAA